MMRNDLYYALFDAVGGIRVIKSTQKNSLAAGVRYIRTSISA